MAQAILLFAVKASIVLLVLGLGLKSRPRDLMYLLHRPAQLVKSLLAMNLAMPLFAAALAATFDLHPAVKRALIVVAVSPVPPILPRKEFKAGGHAAYATGLLATSALLAIVFIPMAVTLIGRAFGLSASMPLTTVAGIVLVTVLVPLTIGCAIARVAPGVAERLAKPVSTIGMLLLVAGVIPILFGVGPDMVTLIGNGTLVAIAAFVVVALAVGHRLGGPTDEDRTVLALSTACRHPGMAVAIATANATIDLLEQKLALAAILLYVVVSVVVTTPYVIWRRRNLPAVADTARKRAA